MLFYWYPTLEWTPYGIVPSCFQINFFFKEAGFQMDFILLGRKRRDVKQRHNTNFACLVLLVFSLLSFIYSCQSIHLNSYFETTEYRRKLEWEEPLWFFHNGFLSVFTKTFYNINILFLPQKMDLGVLQPDSSVSPEGGKRKRLKFISLALFSVCVQVWLYVFYDRSRTLLNLLCQPTI